MRRLYERYAHPLMRIVQGVPMSWDAAIVATKCWDLVEHAAWSPCSRFIAIDCHTEVQVLDAATLKRIGSLAPQQGCARLLSFSPESRSLTRLSDGPEGLISWDLQTGVPASRIPPTGVGVPFGYPEHSFNRIEQWNPAITYSDCGAMFGVLFKRHGVTAITTYNILSKTSAVSHSVEGPVADIIWTHDKCIRFAVFGPGSIIIREVGFISEHPAVEVESLPIPSNFDPSGGSLFLPTLSHLAFVREKSIFVWDAKHSKLLLSCAEIERPGLMSFSYGRFFACATDGPEIYLWKDSPTGYTLHQKLMTHTRDLEPWKPLLSLDGRSLLAFSGPTLQLWHTSDSATFPSSVPTQASQSTQRSFTLGFSPDESLVAAARLLDNTATVLDLRSGIPRLTIDAGMRIYGLGVAESVVVVICEGKIVTWNLPRGDHATVDIKDSIRTTIFDYSSLWPISSASISPDFNHIAVVGVTAGWSLVLNIFDMTTGKHLAGSRPAKLSPVEAWFHRSLRVQGWEIVKDSESGFHKIEFPGSAQHRPELRPRTSPHGYKTTDDGWILNSDGKRLLWLPPHWRLDDMDRMWSGRFLAFLHHHLPEAVILEVLEE